MSSNEEIKETTNISNDENNTNNYHNDDNLHHDDQINKLKYAGFWMRFWAYLVDLIIIGSIVRMLVKPIFRLLDIPLNSALYEIEAFAPITIVSAVIFYSYFVFMTKFLGQTIGKMIFGLKVIPLKGEKLTWGTILFREWIGRFISATTWIGYLVVAFLPQKQGIHDLFSDTTVIYER